MSSPPITRPLLVALLLWGLPVDPPTAQSTQSGCAVCHGAEAKLFAQGVHVSVGVGCTTCHGGSDGTNDQKLAHSEGMVSLRDPRAAVESCATCHSDTALMRGYGLTTDQLALYWTSAHGQHLAETGDPNVATCVDCHGAHGILPDTDPRSPIHALSQMETCGTCHADPELMAPYGLDAGIVDDFRRSVHGVALLEHDVLSSPTCTDCHGSHGALPPRVTELGRVCGSCHSVVQDYFEESPHAAPAYEGAIDECVSCHDHHLVRKPSSAMLIGEGIGHCATCHADADDPGALVASALHTTLASLDERLEDAGRRVRSAAQRGLFLSEEHGYLTDAKELRARARSLTHTLSETRLEDLMSRAEAMIALTYESIDVRERGLRDRKIFTTIFLGLTFLLAAVLITYRRETFGHWRAARSTDAGKRPVAPRGSS